MQKRTAEKLYRCNRCADLHCHWCGRSVHFGEENRVRQGIIATREHLTPKSLGGTDHKHNVALACKRCNNHRSSDLDWVEWHDHLGHSARMGPSQRVAMGVAEISTLRDPSKAKLTPNYYFYSQGNPALKTCVHCGVGHDHLNPQSLCRHCASESTPNSPASTYGVPANRKTRVCPGCQTKVTTLYRKGLCWTCYDLAEKWGA